ncbi:MAG: hypothetical protein H8E26_02455 [FCB group bacterium]|nr:hypothetical protein [FCB group bacterium]MBL7027394.1 hypothetical protein [Candidatus Neomarinimicrobiota bacterium]MBL7122655.1 hypothetical protein [Candidatus Neomarinimicrobiota bacterium]
MKKKTWITTIIILLLTNLNVSGANHREGAKGALMFGVKDYYRLSSFEGTMLSYKKMLDEHNEYRFSLSLSGRYMSPETEHSTIDNIVSQDTVISSSDEYARKTNSWYVSFGAYRIWHQKNDHVVNFYAGFGPYVGYSNYYGRSEDDGYNNRLDIDESFDKSISAGLRTLLGVEVKITERVSLMGEYRPSVSYGKTYSEFRQSWERLSDGDNGVDIRKTVTPSVNFGSTTLFGVAFYF